MEAPTSRKDGAGTQEAAPRPGGDRDGQSSQPAREEGTGGKDREEGAADESRRRHGFIFFFLAGRISAVERVSPTIVGPRPKGERRRAERVVCPEPVGQDTRKMKEVPSVFESPDRAGDSVALAQPGFPLRNPTCHAPISFAVLSIIRRYLKTTATTYPLTTVPRGCGYIPRMSLGTPPFDGALPDFRREKKPAPLSLGMPFHIAFGSSGIPQPSLPSFLHHLGREPIQNSD